MNGTEYLTAIDCSLVPCFSIILKQDDIEIVPIERHHRGSRDIS